MTLAGAVASLGGVGRLPFAPGTWGSAAVLPFVLLGPLPCFVLAAGFTVAGLWAVPRAVGAEDDPGWVVVDEAAGQCLALACLPAGAGLGGVALAFGLFRLFDVTKPGPVGWADRQGGAFGVMADDLIAGAMAGGVVLAARAAGWV